MTATVWCELMNANIGFLDFISNVLFVEICSKEALLQRIAIDMKSMLLAANIFRILRETPKNSFYLLTTLLLWIFYFDSVNMFVPKTKIKGKNNEISLADF
jgi:hypothetical protein